MVLEVVLAALGWVLCIWSFKLLWLLVLAPHTLRFGVACSLLRSVPSTYSLLAASNSGGDGDHNPLMQRLKGGSSVAMAWAGCSLVCVLADLASFTMLVHTPADSDDGDADGDATTMKLFVCGLLVLDFVPLMLLPLLVWALPPGILGRRAQVAAVAGGTAEAGMLVAPARGSVEQETSGLLHDQSRAP